jgi:hypothetical protein
VSGLLPADERAELDQIFAVLSKGLDRRVEAFRQTVAGGADPIELAAAITRQLQDHPPHTVAAFLALALERLSREGRT